ncbi:uncharacterized protein V1518DRAFT_127271 [Limtongia smithiae]|uniref:uncharacterized protein n=1 Tax=Limtongia smithiae TaxID=1125753 RepID=UPI0034CD7A5B
MHTLNRVPLHYSHHPPRHVVALQVSTTSAQTPLSSHNVQHAKMFTCPCNAYRGRSKANLARHQQGKKCRMHSRLPFLGATSADVLSWRQNSGCVPVQPVDPVQLVDHREWTRTIDRYCDYATAYIEHLEQRLDISPNNRFACFIGALLNEQQPTPQPKVNLSAMAPPSPGSETSPLPSTLESFHLPPVVETSQAPPVATVSSLLPALETALSCPTAQTSPPHSTTRIIRRRKTSETAMPY